MRRLIPAFFAVSVLAAGFLAFGQEIAGPVGTYTVKPPAPVTITQGDGWIRFDWAVVPKPTPTPDPPPPVPPTPTPVITYPGKLFVSYVVPESPSQEQAALRSNLAAVDWGKLNAVYHSYLEVDPAVEYLRLMKGRKPPMMLIQHMRDGAKITDAAPIVDEIADPASVEAVKARIARLRGQ